MEARVTLKDDVRKRVRDAVQRRLDSEYSLAVREIQLAADRGLTSVDVEPCSAVTCKKLKSEGIHINSRSTSTARCTWGEESDE